MYISLYLDDPFVTAGNEVLPVVRDIQCINSSLLRSINMPAQLTVEGFPVSDFSVGSTCQNLTAQRMKYNALEKSIGDDHLKSSVTPKNNKS